MAYTMQNPTTLGELRDIVEAGDLAVRNAAGVIATLDESILGPDLLSAPLRSAHQLTVGRLTVEPDDDLLSLFGGAPAYCRWRNSLLRILLLAGSGDTSDPFVALETFADAHGLRRPSRRILDRELPGVLPKDIQREMAIAADRRLRGKRRWSFRHELSVLDRLRRIPTN